MADTENLGPIPDSATPEPGSTGLVKGTLRRLAASVGTAAARRVAPIAAELLGRGADYVQSAIEEAKRAEKEMLNKARQEEARRKMEARKEALAAFDRAEQAFANFGLGHLVARVRDAVIPTVKPGETVIDHEPPTPPTNK